MAEIERERMEYDVVVVGAGPSGLAAAIRLKQLAAAAERELSVCVVEKGSEVGAHILSGAVFEPRALDELIPDWRERGAPLNTPAIEDRFLYLTERRALRLPTPPQMHNHGNYIISLGNLCRWLATAGRGAGRRDLSRLRRRRGALRRRRPGERRRHRRHGHRQGRRADRATPPGVELRAPQTLFAEGCRGSLTKTLIERFQPARRRRPADLRHRPQGIVGGRARAAPSRPRRPHGRLAARRATPMAARSSITSRTARWRSASWSGSTTRTRF